MFSSARSAAEKRSRVFASGATPVLRVAVATRYPLTRRVIGRSRYMLYMLYATPSHARFEVAQPDALFVGFLGILGISNSYLGKCESHRQGARCQEQRVWENRDLRLLYLASACPSNM